MNRVIDWLGRLPVRVRRGLARGAWWSVYPHSAYWRLGGNDAAVEAALRRHACQRGATCWDLGAHYGIYAVGLARAVGPEGRIDAFEPDPVSASRLRWHRRLNRLPHLHIHPVAASAATDSALLYQYHGFGHTTSHLPYPGECTDHVPAVRIQKVRLDEWVASRRLTRPDFVKIDVEGHGAAALEGMKQTLAEAQPAVLLAVHHRAEYNDALALFAGLGYRHAPVSEQDAGRLASQHFGEMLCLPPGRS